jgi:5-dehydro-2-deoxygluconokinase
MGRVAADFYGAQRMTSLEETSTFRRYLGGSSGNVAVGAARLGLRTAMISGVGDDPMGRFVLSRLDAEGVDRSAVRVVPDRRTALVFLGMLGAEAVGLDFYRQAPADEAISPALADRAFLDGVDVLAVTGTHFVAPDAPSAVVLRTARAAGCRIVLDIDHRAGLWGAVDGGAAAARRRVAEVARLADLVVGNVEELEVLGGAAGVMPALRALRAMTGAALVAKLGPEGAACVAGPVPDARDGLDVVGGPRVAVENPVGAGDAFLSAFLSGWAVGAPMEECLARGTHSGALVVSRHACSAASPYPEELAAFRAGDAARADRVHRAMGRIARPGRVMALACDHRAPFEAMMAQHGRGEADAAAFKRLVADAAARVFAARGIEGGAMLMDPRFGREVLEERGRQGWWLGRPVEVTGSRPLEAEAGADLAADLSTWNPAHVAKVLVWHHPDDAAGLREAQVSTLRRLEAGCRAAELEWMLEVVPPVGAGHDDDVLLRGVGQMYDAGLTPDYLKLPALAGQGGWDRLSDLVRARDPWCRGVVVLGLDRPFEDLRPGLELAAAQEACAGFAIGRTVFGEAARRWFAREIGDAEAVDEMARNFDRIVAIFQAGASDAAAPAATGATAAAAGRA